MKIKEVIKRLFGRRYIDAEKIDLLKKGGIGVYL